MAISGLDSVLRNLNKEIQAIEGRTRSGMQQAVLFVKGEAMEQTPHEFGVLLGSAFTGVEYNGRSIVGRVGYTAKYAPFVHEMPTSNNFSKSGTGPKFLEKAVKSNTRSIVRIIQRAATVK